MKPLIVFAVAFTAALSMLGADLADAKRLGGGRSLGTQRQSIAPPAPAAPSATTPSGAAANPVMPAQPGAAAARTAAPAAAPASGMSRWLGPIAGIAAGLGLAALMSHLGLSESFGSLLLIGLLVFGAIFLFRMLAARRAGPQPAVGPRDALLRSSSGAQVSRSSSEPVWGGMNPAAPAAASTVSLPPGFNPGPFLQQAKTQFVRLQAAYDSGDIAALRDVMTPALRAEVERELAVRGAHVPTEVSALDADILQVATEGNRHIASIRFNGRIKEDGAREAVPFVEIWHLEKPVDDSSGWLLAGIQQPDEALTLQ